MVTEKCRKRAHEILDEVISHYNFTSKGLLKITLPINQGAVRSPQVSFENEIGIETRMGDMRVEIVRTERLT